MRSNITISFVFKPYDGGCMVYRITHIDSAGAIPTSITNSYANKITNMIRDLQNHFNKN